MAKPSQGKAAQTKPTRMGRPKVLQGPVQVINLHIESTLCDQIDTAVADAGLSGRAEFIRNAIRHYLETKQVAAPVKPNPFAELERTMAAVFETLAPEEQEKIKRNKDANKTAKGMSLEEYLAGKVLRGVDKKK